MTDKNTDLSKTSLTRPGRGSTKTGGDGSTNRLPSLRGPRDLTLGGIKKKTFAPNIPVRKERVKTEVKPEVKTNVGKDNRGKHGRGGRQRGRGRGFRQREVIQSHSIFESGPTSELSGKRGTGAFTGISESGANQIQKPTFKKESYDPDLEKAESEMAMKRLEEGNASLIVDVHNDASSQPITLPTAVNCSLPSKIKSEKGSQIEAKNPDICSEVFRESDGQRLILFQLPDVLPGTPRSSDDSERVLVKQESGTTTNKKDTKQSGDSKEINKCDIGQLSEGKIGKLQVMKSGKCRLLLGQVVLNLKAGVQSCFSEELVSVSLPPEDSTDDAKGQMSVLGNVNDKIIGVPDMEGLLKATSAT